MEIRGIVGLTQTSQQTRPSLLVNRTRFDGKPWNYLNRWGNNNSPFHRVVRSTVRPNRHSSGFRLRPPEHREGRESVTVSSSRE